MCNKSRAIMCTTHTLSQFWVQFSKFQHSILLFFFSNIIFSFVKHRSSQNIKHSHNHKSVVKFPNLYVCIYNIYFVFVYTFYITFCIFIFLYIVSSRFGFFEFPGAGLPYGRRNVYPAFGAHPEDDRTIGLYPDYKDGKNSPLGAYGSATQIYARVGLMYP